MKSSLGFKSKLVGSTKTINYLGKQQFFFNLQGKRTNFSTFQRTNLSRHTPLSFHNFFTYFKNHQVRNYSIGNIYSLEELPPKPPKPEQAKIAHKYRNVIRALENRLRKFGKVDGPSILKIMKRAGEFSDPTIAKHIFDNFAKYNITPTLEIFNSFMHACAKGRQINRVLFFLEELKRNQFTPDLRTYQSLVIAYTRTRQLDKAENCFKELKEAGIKPDAHFFSVLGQIFKYSGDADKARTYFSEFLSLGLKPTVALLNSFIYSCRKTSNTQNAEYYYRQFKANGLTPTIETALGMVLSAGTDYVKLDEYLRRFTAFHGVELFTAAIANCAAAGSSSSAKQYLEAMDHHGFKPNFVTYYFMLKAYYNNEEYLEGDELYRDLIFKYKIRPNHEINLLHKRVHDDIQERARAKLAQGK